MSELINNYPIFEDNQVLTSGQLNQSVKYLDLQTRLTRSCLIGMGIACGLELEVDEGENTTLAIREGLGISSEGFLIKLCPASGVCLTTRYREYTLPEGTVYTPFQDELFQQDVELHELLTEAAPTDEEDILLPLTSEFLENKVVLLFLECLDKDLKSCLGKSCDELGIDRIFTLRKLLISVEDLQIVNRRSNGGRQDDLFLKKYDLASISLPRVFFDNVHTLHYLPFAYNYAKAMQQVLDPLRKLLEQTYDTYEPVLNEEYEENPFGSPVIQNAFGALEEYLKGGLVNPAWWGVQYVYDFIKDLILAYEEFRECAYDLIWQCCPDMSRFPRHLMLGLAIPEERDPCQIDRFRHAFTQPPIYNLQNQLLAKTRCMHRRIVLMLEKFSFDRLRLKNQEQIIPKATPSCEKKSPLSARAIPFYYDSKSPSAFIGLETLEWEWNYARKHRQCQLAEKETGALNPSYDNNTMAATAKTPLTTPLHFDMDQVNFLRLEGYQGKELREVLSGLNALRKEANVDFDIRTIYFGDEAPDPPLLACLYADLQPDYEIWRAKLLYFLDLVARFTNISRFLSTQRLKVPSTGMFGTTEALAIEPLESELTAMRNINSGLNRANWATALQEVYFETKTVNMDRWTSKEKERATLGAAVNDRRNVGELYEEIRECIAKIRRQTPEALSQFRMNDWLDAYKCPLTIYLELVKLLAERIPRGANTKAFNTIMSLFCALHEVMRNIFIYPYMDIRILWNTVRKRMDQYVENHQFSKFLEDHPGLEHKAGVEQGQTFVLLTQAKYSDRSRELLKSLLKDFWSKEEVPFGEEAVEAFEEVLSGRVVGDFTLPYKCCDPCSGIRPEEAKLDPIAFPICEVVPIRDLGDEKGLSYLRLKEKLFHTVYNPEPYRARLTGEAKFGQAALEFFPYEYDPSKNTQGFTYEVDINKVIAEARNTDSAYLIDTVPYEILDVADSTKIDEAAISVIIPILGQIDSKLIGFRGLVYTQLAAGQIPVEGAEVSVDVQGTKIASTTKKDGRYEILDPRLTSGTYTLRTTATGYFSSVLQGVQLKDEVVSLDVELRPFPILGIDEKNLLEFLKLRENSTKAILINEEYRRSAALYEDAIEKAIRAESDRAKSLLTTQETISRFNRDEKLTAEEMNKIYAENRDLLLKEIGEADSSLTKKNRTNAFRVLTNSYMDRLLLKEPNKLGSASSKILTQTSKLIEKSGVSMKANFNSWAAGREKVLGEAIVNRVRSKFKI